jgi:DNA-binding NtrC family response regulator
MAPEFRTGPTARIHGDRRRVEEISLPSIRVIVVCGPQAGRQWTMSVPCVRLGSGADNDIILDDPTVSRRHATLQLTDDGLLLRDLESTNGTFVESVRTREAFLNPGADVRLGNCRLTVQFLTETYDVIPQETERFGALIGSSTAMKEVYGMLRAIAGTPATVLVEGESGTGKELVAQTIHDLSGRKGTLIPFDCAGTQPQLIQSELFGHVKGAFTGSSAPREGAFRAAHGGTLFLDELGELPLELQPILLRCLESREVKPVGADHGHPVDVRLVAATNRDLEEMVAQKAFRADLFHRLSVIRVRLPALRERREDIVHLAENFVGTMKLDISLTPDAVALLRAHTWPGNVRELRNVVERLGRLFAGQEIQRSQVEKVLPATPAADAVKLEDIERKTILRVMKECGGNRAQAAETLGISPSTLKRKLRQYRNEP